MAASRGLLFWLPKPKSFLGLMSLPTGTEIIALAMLFNKATGLYGLLAILTGYAVSALQLSMYIYSVLALAALAYLFPHIRRQTPFHALGLAWLYVVDTLVNAAYVTRFAVVWYLATASPDSDVAYTPDGPEVAKDGKAGGGGTANGTAAAAVAAAVAGAAAGEQGKDTALSMVLVVFFSLLRVYLCLVVMSFARQALVRRMAGRAGPPEVGAAGGGAPFAAGTPEGEGWKGRLGRVMVSVGRSYWLPGGGDAGDGDEEAEWTRNVGSKFRSRRRKNRRYGPLATRDGGASDED